MLVFCLVTLPLVAACTGELGPNAEPTSGTLAERSLDLLDPEIGDRLRAMPWVTDGSVESGAFVGALLTVERSGEYPGQAERKTDISEVLDALQEASWYSPNLDSGKKLLLASLFEIYQLGHQTTPDGLAYKPVFEWRPTYPWMQLIDDVISLDLHIEHHSASGAPVQLIAWGDDTESVKEALSYASEHIGGIEQFAGKHDAKYVLVVVDSGLRTATAGEPIP